MNTASEESLNVEEMLETMEARIHGCEVLSQRSLLLLAQARDQVGRFRAEPIGGRLLPLKRVIYWFSASAFDRQYKVHEAVLNAIDELAREIVELRNQIAVVRMERGHRSPPG